MYSAQHGLTKLSSTIVYCLFFAAMVLLVNITTTAISGSEENREQLKVAIHHLRAIISRTWSAPRMRLLVLRHVGECFEVDLDRTGLEPGALPGDGESSQFRGKEFDLSPMTLQWPASGFFDEYFCLAYPELRTGV